MEEEGRGGERERGREEGGRGGEREGGRGGKGGGNTCGDVGACGGGAFGATLRQRNLLSEGGDRERGCV